MALTQDQIQQYRNLVGIKTAPSTSLSPEEIKEYRRQIGIEPTGDIYRQSVPFTMKTDTSPAIPKVSEDGFFKPTEKVRLRDVVRESANVLGSVGNAIISSERKLGETLADALYAGRSQKTLAKQSEQENQLANQLVKKILQLKSEGKDVSKLMDNYYRISATRIPELAEIAPSVNKTKANIAGESLGTTIDILSAGTYGMGKKAVTGSLTKATPSIIEKGASLVKEPAGLFTKQGAKIVAEGTGLGYGVDVALGLQGDRGENREGISSVVPGLGTAIGFAIPAIPLASRSVKNVATKEARQASIIARRKKELEKVASLPTLNKVVNKGADRGVNILDTLSQTDVLVGSVDNNGTIKTKGLGGPVEQYTDQFISGKESVVSDILKKEGKAIAPQIVYKKLRESIKNAGIEGEALESALRKIKAEMRGYALRSTDGGAIPLETLHRAKIDKYNSINFFTEGNTKKYSKVVAKALKEIVQDNTDNVDIRILNRELQKHYAVIDFLERLNGRKVDGGKLGKYFRSAVGAMVGSNFGPVGSVVGAEIGGRAQGVAMTKAFGRAVNKEIPTAQIYNQAEEYLQKQPLALPQSSNSAGSRTIAQTTNSPQPNSVNIPQSIPQATKNVKQDAFGAVAGIEQDEEGNIAFNKEKATLGVLGMASLSKAKGKLSGKSDDIVGNIKKSTLPYKETGNLTTKILKDLEGKTTVSKQYILDATNRGELKQVERDITRQVLNTMPDGQINVKEFADKVKSELLPLKRGIPEGKIFRGDNTKIALNKMDTTKVFNPAEKEALEAFNNTPGLYFTDSLDNAKSYGENITEVSVGQDAVIIDVDNVTKVLKREDVEKIIKNNPKIKDWALNWSENFDDAIEQITDSVMAEKDGNEFLKAIWADGGFSESDFVVTMKKFGIDGIKVKKDGVTHYVIYNRDILK